MALIGIDIGTQSLKVVVTGDDLAVFAAASRAYPVHRPHPGWAEQDPREWEAALAPAVAQALAAAQCSAGDIRGIGVSGQLDGCMAVGAGGAALSPCLIWQDRRATSELPDSVSRPGACADGFLQTTGLIADAGHMAAKIRWLKRHHLEPEDRRSARYHQPVSYLVERLCGEYVFDHGLASTTMLYSLADRDYDGELLAGFEIARDELPQVAGAGAVAGVLSRGGAEISGLLPGTPVAVGTGDDFATPLGAGLVAPGRMACVVGTGEVVGALNRDIAIDRGRLVETHCYANDYYFIENPGWLSGGAMAWLRRLLGRDFVALDAAAAGVAPGADGLLFLPALSGAMAPEWIASARGCFYGLTDAHEAGHLARAVMEGCAFAMRDVADRLGELGVATEAILLLGGGARSQLWGQIRADVTGLPVARAEQADTCPIGAALLAGQCAGVIADLDRGAELLAPGITEIAPRSDLADCYGEAHERYRLLFDSLRPLY